MKVSLFFFTTKTKCMFFASNSIAETLSNTATDIFYGKPRGYSMMVILHPSIYKELFNDLKSWLTSYEINIGNTPTTITLNGHTLIFITSLDIPKDKVYLVEDGMYHTITHQQTKA